MKSASEFLKEAYAKIESRQIADEEVEKILIEAIESYASQSKWISVEERPPTKDDADIDADVLAWDGISCKVRKAYYVDVAKMKIRFKMWQPLPAAPK